MPDTLIPPTAAEPYLPATMLLIQPIRNGDEQAVIRLWHLCGLTRPWNDPATDLALARANRECDVFVGLDDDGKIVATVMAGCDGHRGWMYYLAVDPTCQQQGHGRQLVRHAEDWLRSRGVPKVMLMVRDTNLHVRDFYERLEYRAEPVITLSRWLIEPPASQSD